MCGINGFNWNDREIIEKMNNAVKHRGPDRQGVYVDDKIDVTEFMVDFIENYPQSLFRYRNNQAKTEAGK